MDWRHRVCPSSGARFLTNPLRRLIHSPERILDGHIHSGDTVLDFGCGPGFFTIPMARMVGDAGTVWAVDIQNEMLGFARETAERNGFLSRIRFHRSSGGSLDLDLPPVVSFVLAFHVMHETTDQGAIFADLHRVLRIGGLLLLAEPMGVVGVREFRETLRIAERAGFAEIARPFILLSRSVLLEKRP
jgi:ubiquinone/menaquinone biosynthesis C-methylase UbiE